MPNEPPIIRCPTCGAQASATKIWKRCGSCRGMVRRRIYCCENPRCSGKKHFTLRIGKKTT
ncbi:MAG TPA: hypothetical protein VMW52_10065 [Phycisphaerae bacterium]|nr:hypothetical protein [Phycisphaerae bacterium]